MRTYDAHFLTLWPRRASSTSSLPSGWTPWRRVPRACSTTRCWWSARPARTPPASAPAWGRASRQASPCTTSTCTTTATWTPKRLVDFFFFFFLSNCDFETDPLSPAPPPQVAALVFGLFVVLALSVSAFYAYKTRSKIWRHGKASILWDEPRTRTAEVQDVRDWVSITALVIVDWIFERRLLCCCSDEWVGGKTPVWCLPKKLQLIFLALGTSNCVTCLQRTVLVIRLCGNTTVSSQHAPVSPSEIISQREDNGDAEMLQGRLYESQLKETGGRLHLGCQGTSAFIVSLFQHAWTCSPTTTKVNVVHFFSLDASGLFLMVGSEVKIGLDFSF